MLRVVLFAAVFVLASMPASAQIDLTGSWASRLHEDYIERGPGSDLADFTGLPLSDEGRARALAYEPTLLSMTERQCLLWSPWSFLFRPLGLRIWSEFDDRGAVVAWHIGGDFLRDVMTIWMDGRPHPSGNAFYPFSGFTTGTWEGDTLTVRTTHLKATTIRRGNGIPASDQATVTAHLTRHDDLLTIIVIQEDPVYLTEPHVVSRTFQLDPRGNIGRFNVCTSVTEIPRLEDSGIVPHYGPGENPQADHMVRTYHLPREAAMGYAATLYPEYRKTMKGYAPPAQCTRYCCGWIEAQGRPEAAPNLTCKTDGGR